MAFDPNKPYDLPPLPPSTGLNSPALVDEMLKARVALAELKGYSHLPPNPLLLLSPSILRESVASSEIENIHTTLLDVLQYQLFPEIEQRESDKEVLRYRDAVLKGFNALSSIPLATRLIRRVHHILMPNLGGKYRQLQNKIINAGTGRVLYTPPPANEIQKLMSDWEHFVNKSNDDIDPLVKVIIGHYQFEAIHPFGDGNGRCGRILMMLQLVQAELLTWPVLYISGYLIRNRDRYYQSLRAITAKGEWVSFILFMLKGFKEQAAKTKSTLLAIMELFDEYKERLKQEHSKIYSAEIVEALFSYPVLTPVFLSKKLDIHYTTASRYLKALAKGRRLSHKKLGKYQLYINKPLLALLQDEKT